MKIFTSLIFNIIFYIVVIFSSITIILLYPIINDVKIQKIASFWVKVIIYLLKIICGVKWEIYGLKNIPKSNFIVVSNHQGLWESLFLQTLFIPSSTIIKKELLFIPLFGWALSFLKPIAIKRKKKITSIKEVIKKGSHKLKNGYNLIIFPEGTRARPEKGLKKFSNSYAHLSYKNNVPVLPIYHNSGLYWRNRKFIKNPGMIKVIIGEPINGRSPKDIHTDVQNWFNDNSNK